MVSEQRVFFFFFYCCCCCLLLSALLLPGAGGQVWQGDSTERIQATSHH
jgi:hypothetical protein